MKQVKLYFTDFSSGFVIKNDFFYKIMSAHYDIILDKENPDYIIYSCYGNEYLKYDCIRIYYTAENLRPDFNLCDYAIGFDDIIFNDRYVRFPNFARYDQFPLLIESNNKNDLTKAKREFCNFIYSNSNADPKRDNFFRQLNKYRKVDSLGKHLNNTNNFAGERYSDDWRETKVEIQKKYKFSIAFENSLAHGYTSEKIMHAFISDTIPIYWGNPEIAKDFNTDAFINCHDYKSFDEVIEKIIELDNDDKKYLEMLNQPPFKNNIVPYHLNKEVISNFFNHIFEQPLNECRRRPQFGTTILYENKIKQNL